MQGPFAEAYHPLGDLHISKPVVPSRHTMSRDRKEAVPFPWCTRKCPEARVAYRISFK